MKFWPTLALLLLAPQCTLHGQAAEKLMEKGSTALAAGLWEVAELHFSKALTDSSITADFKAQITVGLAEALIRERNPTAALDLLRQEFLAGHPEVAFWQAQALGSLGRHDEAIGLFTSYLATAAPRHQTEAAMTQASLLLASGQAQAALDTLASLVPHAVGAPLTRLRLAQVEILIDLDRLPEARASLPPNETALPAEAAHTTFLDAQLLLRENRPAEAEAAFQGLVNHPQDQPPSRYQAAALGLADAMHAQGKIEQATLSLLAFIQNHPLSPQLESLFQRLLRWLPDKPTAADPILMRTAEWITPPALRAYGIIADSTDSISAAPAAWPADSPKNDSQNLLAYALYTHALALHGSDIPQASATSRQLLDRLRFENPQHPLAARALYQLAAWHLENGFPAQALAILQVLDDSPAPATLKAQATFLQGRIQLLLGNLEKTSALFEQAALALNGADARLAKRHAAISRFRNGTSQASVPIQQTDGPADPILEADIQLEQALTTTPPSAALAALSEFIDLHPAHPRLAEARLAALEAALATPTPDLNFARSQFDSLTTQTQPPTNTTLAPVRIAIARLLIAQQAQDPAATIAAAQAILADYPTDPRAADAALTLGRCLFQASDYHAARLVLEKLAATDTDPVRAQVAWLLAARSAALGGTPQSKEQALGLFDHAISGSAPLSAVATLEKADHLIEMYRLTDAATILQAWIKALPAADPLQLPAGLLLGEALYAQGPGNPASLLQALAVYDNLLTLTQDQPALFNRLQYLRGITLEQLPDPTDPSKKREKEAFQAFLSVLDTTTSPLEWEYFERSGFRALSYLEKDESRIPAAITIAKKIASFQGPRAAEAAARASNLQLIAPWVD